MMIEFSIDRTHLMRALYPLIAVRTGGKAAALDYVDITAKKDEVEFASTGMSSSFGADVVSSGCARVPFPLFESLFRGPENLAVGRISIQIEERHIKAGPTAISDPTVSVRVTGPRIADLPLDAPL